MKCPASLYRSAVLPKIKHYRRDITFHINASFSLKCKIFREYMVILQSKRKKPLIKKCFTSVEKRGWGFRPLTPNFENHNVTNTLFLLQQLSFFF